MAFAQLSNKRLSPIWKLGDLVKDSKQQLTRECSAEA
jgi:hypothetical protein